LEILCLVCLLALQICERGFSTQNIIKTKLRNRMTLENLDSTMRIMLEGGSYKDFDFGGALATWSQA